jgi:hypothetical protein
MTTSLTRAGLWAIIGSIVAMVPRRFHGPGVVALVGTGIPLPGRVTWQNGPLWDMPVLAGGALLRWPILHLLRRLRRREPRQEPAQ